MFMSEHRTKKCLKVCVIGQNLYLGPPAFNRPTHFFGEKGPVIPGLIGPTHFWTASASPEYVVPARLFWFARLEYVSTHLNHDTKAIDFERFAT